MQMIPQKMEQQVDILGKIFVSDSQSLFIAMLWLNDFCPEYFDQSKATFLVVIVWEKINYCPEQ